MSRLSPEAAHERYLYNKKYQTKYWERRASKNVSSKSKVSVEVEIPDKLISEIDEVEVSVKRSGRSQERYIKDLERSNRTLNAENRRLVKELSRYQEIIRIGLKQINHEEQIF